MDPLIIEPVEKQGIGKYLKGSAIIAKVMGVFITVLLNGTKNSSVPRVFELNDYKYLIPRI